MQRNLPDALRVPVAPGELLDKLTILEIKSERIADPAKLGHVRAEWALLQQVRERELPASAELAALCRDLKYINESLWAVEDELRLCERNQEFGDRFVELARSVYRLNDRRGELKRSINELLGACIQEQKQYQHYELR